ncbi:MAG: Maf family protein, partial [Nitrospinota bacterium]
MSNVVLASASPRRVELLKKLVENFTVFPSSVNETLNSESPEENAKRLAFEKANQISARFPDSIVIGADTIVAWNSEIFGKPTSPQDATRILKALRGKKHSVITGVAVIKGAYKRVQCLESTVCMKKVGDQDILAYVETGEPMDKAGAYGIQGKGGDMVVDSYRGSYSNIVGLPVELLEEILQDSVFRESISW